MKIGELAMKAEVTAQAVRFYERRGLLGKPARTVSGYRDYDPKMVTLLRSIKRAQDLGFTLKEIKIMRDLHDRPADHLEARRFAKDKLRVLDEKIAWLQKMKTELRASLRRTEKQAGEVCPAGENANAQEPVAVCPVRRPGKRR